jgi:peptidoglycan hydrolase CwlO-like protein
MPYYVIGEDKGLEEAYSADEIDAQMQTVNQSLQTANNNISTIQNNISTINTNLTGKQKTITVSDNAPSGGANGDIWIEY